MGEHAKPKRRQLTGRRVWLLIQIAVWMSSHFGDQ
ncbi:hypothetical protein SAMN05428942_2180 [Streptomyces sp. 2112.2]|nr:hypothetical protein SAMN05428942_2180 [Streptomyces sp. 2112.2]